jgi:putative ABC transport system substrate-binding protein
MPGAVRFAVLVNPNNLDTESLVKDLQAAAVTIGRQIEVFAAGTNREIDMAFANLVQRRSDALLVSPDPLFDARRVQLATLATHHRMPAIYSKREDAEAGRLMSYGMSFTDMFRLTGIYTGRILKGEKPADLPVMRPTKFEFIINQQTASPCLTLSSGGPEVSD